MKTVRLIILLFLNVCVSQGLTIDDIGSVVVIGCTRERGAELTEVARICGVIEITGGLFPVMQRINKLHPSYRICDNIVIQLNKRFLKVNDLHFRERFKEVILQHVLSHFDCGLDIKISILDQDGLCLHEIQGRVSQLAEKFQHVM